jgi:ribosome-associated toxin RatA of RatAB toxin-antitoxin module
MPKILKTVEIKAPPELFINDVVLDFEKYPDFVNDVREVKLVEKNHDTFRVEFHIRVIKDITYTLLMRRESDFKVSWELVKGDFMKTNKGYWEVKQLPSNRIKATYGIEIELPFFIPKSVTKALIEKSLPEMLIAFKQRAELLVNNQKGEK